MTNPVHQFTRLGAPGQFPWMRQLLNGGGWKTIQSPISGVCNDGTAKCAGGNWQFEYSNFPNAWTIFK